MISIQGTTLAISLLLLFMVTLLATSSMYVINLEEKMSSNLENKIRSFNAAESGLSGGEAWLLSLTQEPIVQATCNMFPCVHIAYEDLHFVDQDQAFWEANAQTYGTPLSHIATQPRYLIEFIQFVPDSPAIGSSSMKNTGVFYYQITSYGTGSTDDAISILQSNFARRF